MYREENLTIDLKVKEYNPICLKQMDTTKLKIKLTDNGLLFDLTNLNVYIIFMKPNKTIVMQSSDIVTDNNVINITLLEDCLRMAGKANMEVELKEDTSVVSSFSIPIVIEPTAKENIHSNDTPNYIETLEEAILLEERRKIAESLRQEAEEKRRIAEISRSENEIERNFKEEDRVSAENIREENEEQRKENEKRRIANEIARINAENIRKENEEQRVIAENLREQQFEEIKESGFTTKEEFIELKNNLDDIANRIVNAEATTDEKGLMSAEDKQKLDSIDVGANKTVVNNTLTSTSVTEALSAAQGKVLNDKILNLKGTILYENNTGTTGTVTLSETAANFNYLEIFYKDANGNGEYSSVRIFKPNEKNVSLNILSQSRYNVNSLRYATKTVKIEGTTISNLSNIVGYIEDGSFQIYDTAEISILAVIGYR